MASQSLIFDQLSNMMHLSEKLNKDYTTCASMIRDMHVVNRSYAIEWMKKILVGESQEFVDMGIQIFDRYLIVEYATNPNCLADTLLLCHVAACSVLLSMKLLETNSRQRLNMCRFHAFSNQALQEYEVKILRAIHGSIYPNCTPRSFVVMLLKCCPPPVNVESLLKTVDVMMTEFDEHPALLMFAPSTIAISALLLAFSHKHMGFDCSDWLATLPNFCLPGPENKLFYSNPDALNIEKCVNFLVELPPLLRVLATPSPSSVADMM